MKAKLVQLLRIVRPCVLVWPCGACLWLAPSPPVLADEPKPRAKTPDIQGTWNLVSWERGGKEQKLPKARFFITESMLYAEGVPFPNDERFKLWPYELEPSGKPGVAFMSLSGLQGRVVVPGICGLDGATLRVALGPVTATHALPLKEVKVDRPMGFATKPGTDQVSYVLKRADAPDDPVSLLRKLGGSPNRGAWGYINLGHERTKQTKNEDLAIIKKYPMLSALALRRCQITDAGLVHLKDMADLEYLTLDGMPITNAGLVHLEGLPKLIELDVNCAKVTGAGLQRLTRLQSLGLQDSPFTDADLAHLVGLTKLERLDLEKTAITDAGLAHLKPLANLDRLFLDKTKVTDAGLEHLHGLTKLRHLRLKGTKVTDKGIEALRAAIPRIEEIER